MSKIDELLKKYCPNGVKTEKLGGICSIRRGERVTRSQIAGGGQNPVYQNSLSPLGYYDKVNREANIPFVIIGGAAGEIGFSDVAFWAADDCLTIDFNSSISNRYIYYVLKNSQQYLLSRVRKSSVPRLSRDVLDNFQIPVPPLPVQEEIVRILDKFTSLEAELEAELEARRKQYEYYRDKLLSFSEIGGGVARQVRWMKMSEVCYSIKDGMHNLPKTSIDKCDVPILSALNIQNGTIDYSTKRYTDFKTYEVENKRTNVEVNDVLLTIVATIGRSAVVKENLPVLLQRSVCVLKPKDFVLPLFLKFYLDTYKMQNYMQSNAHGSAQAGLYLNQVAEMLIPIPPLAEQERIVAILDKFDALVNDISTGLPAEIEARRKQYEYYRDKLLTF